MSNNSETSNETSEIRINNENNKNNEIKNPRNICVNKLLEIFNDIIFVKSFTDDDNSIINIINYECENNFNGTKEEYIQLICNKIENSIYKYTMDVSEKKGLGENININNKYFRRIYVNKLRSIYENINPNSYVQNKNFISMILQKDFDIDNIAFMSPQELFQEHWKPYMDKLNATNKFMDDAKFAGVETTEYLCQRCRHPDRKCTYYQLQTRGCDEPMTTFVTCKNSGCGNKWRFNQ